MEERISSVEDIIGEFDSSVKDSIQSKRSLTQNIQEIWDTMKGSNLRIIRIKEEVQLKRHRKHIQQNHRRKLSQSKERHA